MRRKWYGIIILAFLLALPLSAMAMSHEKEEMEHGSMKGMEDGKMMMDENMAMLGDQTVDGVKAMAHMKDVGEKMAEMGMDATHHFMVMFKDTSSGDPIEEGMVAVKVTTPSGKTLKPTKLMGMQGHFGADISLKEKGTYEFEVGTKLKDGQKRTYAFDYVIE